MLVVLSAPLLLLVVVLPLVLLLVVLLALLVLLLGVRPLAKALLRKREDARPTTGALPIAGDGVQLPAQVSPEMLAGTGLTLGDRVGLVRDFTRENPARAALAVRDMIRTEAN